MLKRQNRLSKIAKKTNGKRFFSPLFNIQVSGNNLNDARFGFIVSKKIDKRAVIRNTTKRVLQKAAEAFLESQRGQDIILIAKQPLSFSDLDKVTQELKKVLTR
jgi:ribonuclease P protein component